MLAFTRSSRRSFAVVTDYQVCLPIIHRADSVTSPPPHLVVRHATDSW
jgi:hypothetical protein